MRSTILIFVAVAIVAMLCSPLYAQISVGVFDPGTATMTKVENQDLMGSNIRYFDLKQGETCQTCIDACLKDPNCKAYTYTKPGFQAPYGRCYLKSSVPDASVNNNCISGVKKYPNDPAFKAAEPSLNNKTNTMPAQPTLNIKNVSTPLPEEKVQKNPPDTLYKKK